MAREGKPTLYVLAGPEGAGKSTFEQTTLQQFTRNTPVISADRQQADTLGSNKANAHQVGDMMAHTAARKALEGKKDFVYETRFADRKDVQLVEEAKAKGYRVVLFHLQTKSADLSVARVAERVKEGGRDVPEAIVRADYAKAPPLIREASAKADMTIAYDTSALNRAPTHVLSLDRGQVVKTADNMPAWASQTYGQQLQRATPEQHNAAVKSFDAIQLQARELGGKDARVGIAGHKQDSFRGPIVAESQHHVLQQVGDKHYVAHFKDRLVVPVARDQEVKINYPATRDRGSVTFEGADRGVRTDAQLKAEAIAYKTLPREQALKEHPTLKPAYAAEDAMRKVAERARPANETVAKQVDGMIKDTVAARVQVGQSVEVDYKLANAVRYQVASRSLDHAVGEKMIHPERHIKLDPVHRDLLVSRADAVMRNVEGKVATIQEPDRASLAARDIAGRIAQLDGKSAENPFTSKTLAQEYKQQQDRSGGADRGAAARAAAKGMER